MTWKRVSTFQMLKTCCMKRACEGRNILTFAFSQNLKHGVYHVKIVSQKFCKNVKKLISKLVRPKRYILRSKTYVLRSKMFILRSKTFVLRCFAFRKIWSTEYSVYTEYIASKLNFYFREILALTQKFDYEFGMQGLYDA